MLPPRLPVRLKKILTSDLTIDDVDAVIGAILSLFANPLLLFSLEGHMVKPD
jgi:hypothetical protein